MTEALKLNLADIESQSFEDLPVGKYDTRITDWEPRQAGENAKNPGLWYLNVEFTVQNGQYEDRRMWTNVNFSENALFTLKGLAEALDIEDDINDLEFVGDTLEEQTNDACRKVGGLIEGKPIGIRFGKMSKKQSKQALDSGYEPRNQVKGFYAWDGEAPSQQAAKAGSSNSLLP